MQEDDGKTNVYETPYANQTQGDNSEVKVEESNKNSLSQEGVKDSSNENEDQDKKTSVMGDIISGIGKAVYDLITKIPLIGPLIIAVLYVLDKIFKAFEWVFGFGKKKKKDGKDQTFARGKGEKEQERGQSNDKEKEDNQIDGEDKKKKKKYTLRRVSDYFRNLVSKGNAKTEQKQI